LISIKWQTSLDGLHAHSRQAMGTVLHGEEQQGLLGDVRLGRALVCLWPLAAPAADSRVSFLE
jgi:hypothetical protein